jgi:hypothetical protein
MIGDVVHDPAVLAQQLGGTSTMATKGTEGHPRRSGVML